MTIPAHIMKGRRPAFAAALAAALIAALAGCVGEDYTPVYFPPPDSDVGAPQPGVAVTGRSCRMIFTSRLCVAIKGDKIEAGLSADEALCAEVPPFPIHISGGSARIEGSEFPDIGFEGHGLPAPITINAKGHGDGLSNVGHGSVDAAGNITISGFSFYILALGIVGEVPNLTLTTGSTPELDHLPSITGASPDASGAMTLVTGTKLGRVIEAADEYLLGASLTAKFRGSVSPTLAECGEEAERAFEVRRIAIAQDGGQTESALPEDRIMEMPGAAFIAENHFDVGPAFESSAKFRVQNISGRAQSISIPSRKGPFYISSLDALTGQVPAGRSFMLTVTFRPSSPEVQPGTVVETLTIGPDAFQLTARARSKSGSAELEIVDESGSLQAPNVDEIKVGDTELAAAAERRFFLCRTIDCGGAQALTDCGECPDPSTMPCDLLAISTEGAPLAEVDSSCMPAHPGATPMYNIDLKGSASVSVSGGKQVLALRNRGVEDLAVKAVEIQEVEDSLSTGQFSLPDGAVFASDDFSKIQQQVSEALEGGSVQGTPMPFTLPPYRPGYSETAAYIVITYTPDDLVGSDGQQAGVGSKVTDRAVLRITTSQGDITAEVIGTTSISESPPLELYVKTRSGARRIEDGGSFPFRDITAETTDAAVPLFMRVPDTAQSALRVRSISVSGPDAGNFSWLGTKQEIESVNPDPGKGSRCSIPIVDEESGELTGEEFDLNPLPLSPPGFDMAPGAYSKANMPLFGCIAFRRSGAEGAGRRLYEGSISVEAVQLAASGMPEKNPDGSERVTSMSARLLAAVDPLTGRMVLRITQSSAAILNPQFPGLSAISSYEDLKRAHGKEPAQQDLQLFTGALVLDPFDEMTITTADGSRELTSPNDGVTAVFRPVDTHPVSNDYAEELLFDFANLIHDALLPEGGRGVYEDYPNVPGSARMNGWRIYTSTLSYPGPLAPPHKVPENVTDCVVINPCDPEQLKLFTEAGAGAGKGACAFFYASGGRYDSPAFHSADVMPGGEYANLCTKVDTPQGLLDIDTGRYTVDGHIHFEEAGLRFFGPTYFHNPGGPLGPKPAMDEVFRMAFTTGVLRPQQDESDMNLIPDEKVDIAAGEHKINLNDPALATPPICAQNTGNWIVGGKAYSKWRYLEGLLFKDEEGTIPAGCPEPGNAYNGGQAFLRGRPVDPETGNLTVVGGAKFGSSDDLSFAFKDVMMFIVLNGWLCDPEGSEDDFEGSRCFDLEFNHRDAASQKSIIDD